jgi:hypothetical protein
MGVIGCVNCVGNGDVHIDWIGDNSMEGNEHMIGGESIDDSCEQDNTNGMISFLITFECPIFIGCGGHIDIEFKFNVDVDVDNEFNGIFVGILESTFSLLFSLSCS